MTRESSSKSGLAPRKAPRQERAVATVETILEGAARILRRGDRLTTNHVAQEAGVSVGSLYQYFPNAAAIVAALINRHVEAEIASVQRILAGHHARQADQTIADLVETFASAHTSDHALARALHATAPRFGLENELAQKRDAQADAIAASLDTNRARTRLAVAAIEGAVLAELARGHGAEQQPMVSLLVAMAKVALDRSETLGPN